MNIEYWVWYTESDSIQGRPIAKFDDLDECKKWCEEEFGGFVVIGWAFGSEADTKHAGTGIIGAVEDYTSDYHG